MKPDIQTLQDTFKIGYDNFEESRKEAEEVFDLYHNRQYSAIQEAILEARGQPKETYNVIKMFSRMFLGYLNSVVNDIKINPRQQSDIYTASILNDLVSYTIYNNNFTAEAEKIKLDGLLAGLMCAYEKVVKTGEKDPLGNDKYEIELCHIPCQEIILDPYSRKEDYSDARFIHRYKWVTEEDVINNFGSGKLSELQANVNMSEVPEADLTETFKGGFQGKYKMHNMYLVVHSIIKDKDTTWSVFWCDNVILDKKEIPYDRVKFPYRVQKINYSNITEYYGLFRDVVETQKAINQALLKIQTLVNTKKVFVETTAVDNMQNFANDMSKVNGIIPVKSIAGILVDSQTKEISDQYIIIDKAVERIKALLAINDSFLGMAPASDSGKKVAIQQNASVVALRYLTTNIESFYKLLGTDILYLIQQYFTYYDVIGIADEYAGMKWLEINRPEPKIDPRTGQPIPANNIWGYEPLLEESIDVRTGKPKKDRNGNLVMQPVPTRESDIQFTKADVIVQSVAYNDELQQNQQLLDSVLNGNLGQFLMQVNPAGYLQIASRAILNLKSKVSPELAEIMSQTSSMITQQQQMQQQMLMQQQMNGGMQ